MGGYLGNRLKCIISIEIMHQYVHLQDEVNS